MPKPRYLAPWHQPDLIAALKDSEGLTPEELEALRGKPAIYHCISRVVDRQFVLGDAEKEQFVTYLRMYEAFSQVRVLTHCVMSNHFHILLEVPAPPPDRGASWSDRKFLRHLETLYSAGEVAEVGRRLRELRKNTSPEAAEAFREKYFRRMWDLSQFMKTLKQRFTRWFNRTHGRTGTLWEERFKSVLVEDGHAARTMAAYIDLNPVRAGLVDDPKDYRWCGYAEAVAGKERAREGLQRVMFEAEAAVNSEELAAGLLLSWRRTAHRYREVLYLDLNRHDANLDPEGAPQLTEAQALRCRVRYFVDGLAIGSKRFIDQVFGLSRGRFGEKRRSGARKLRRIDTPLRTLRDLQKEAVG
jgi:putative transposase